MALVSNRLITLLMIAGIAFMLLNGCRGPKQKYLTTHLTEALIDSTKNIANVKGHLSGIQFLDSVYAHIGKPSEYDKIKRHLVIAEITLGYSASEAKMMRDSCISHADSAIVSIETLQLNKPLNDEYIEAFRLKGERNLRLKQYSEAVKFISRARFLSHEKGDSCQTAKITALLANVAWQQKKFSKAAVLFEEAVYLFGYCSSNRDRFFSVQGNMDNTGISLLRSGRPVEAIQYLKKTAQYILQNRELCLPDTLFPNEALVVVYGNMADGYELMDMPDSSRVYLNAAINIKRQYLHLDMDAVDYIQFSSVELRQKNFKLADEYLQQAETYFPKIDANSKAIWYKNKAVVSHHLGKFADEAGFYKKYSLLKDTLYSRDIKLVDTDPDREYDQLLQQYELEKANGRTKINQLYFYGALIIILLIVLFAVQVWLSLAKSRRLNDVLAQRETELELLLSDIESRKDSEKRHELFSLGLQLQEEYNEKIKQQQQQISDDMHDELSGSLAALKYYIEDLKARAASETERITLSTLESEVSSIYENARHYMHNLRNRASAEKLDLPGFLTDIRERFLAKELITINNCIDEEGIRKLSLQQNNNLYFVIKEALANIIKHSHATTADIEISFDKNICTFCIADNGDNRQIESRNRGMGMNSMEKRIKDTGGNISFSADEKGTMIKGNFPVIP